jgi:radical SAM superfamily enzyme YgiQ (UPF0313 family)
MQNISKNILMIYPQHTKTFWGFENVMKILGKKAAYPPLGILTISSMLPGHWSKKLVDLNTEALSSSDIAWADFVFISAMIVQKESALKVIERVRQSGKPIVAGGPLFTTGSEDFPFIDHLFLGEAENTLKDFINDVEKNTLKRIYQAVDFPDLGSVPVPDWSLINPAKYHSMSLQYSRGCPFNCEFCDIVILNGRNPRTKTKEQVIAELDALYKMGWHEGVFFVDDNLIGNKNKLKTEILPAIIEWQKTRKYPFTLNTQVSINLTDDEEMIRLMVDAGFTTVFIGIETPDEASLEECSKFQNQNRNLVSGVKKLQNFGLEVQGGFIVGFDSDTPAIFQKQIEFIQKSGIVTAMVGLLTALPKTRLHKRLEENKRIVRESSANNTIFSTLNFIPRMDKKILFSGYTEILETIYNPKNYYERIKTFLREFRPVKKDVSRKRIQKFELRAFFGSIWLLGIKSRGRSHFWNLLFWVALKYPGLFHQAISSSLAGVHLRTVISGS